MIVLLLLFICSSFSQFIPKPRPSEVLSNKVYELGELYKKLLVESAGFFSDSEQSIWGEDSSLENEESVGKELNVVDSLKTKKRFESQSSIIRNCNYGKPYESVSTFNHCDTGKLCKISELLCNDVVIDSSNTNNIPSNLSGCLVKSLRCSKGQTYNQSHFGTQCKVQKWVKSISGILGGDNMTEIFPFDETLDKSDVFSLYTQLDCQSHVIYGWNGWNFTCKSEELTCHDDTNTSCHSLTKTCYGKNMTTTCNSIIKNCQTTPIDTIVSLCNNVVNESVECGNWNDLLCKPRDITCSGTKLDAQSYNGDISRCETIQSLKCNDEVKYLPSGPTAICRILGVSCNGVPQLFTNMPKFGANCSITSVTCATVSLTGFNVGCKTFLYGCKDSTQPNCSYSEVSNHCTDQCNQEGIETLCHCPRDFTGPNCQTRRQLQFGLQLISPEENNSTEIYLNLSSVKSEKLTFDIITTYADKNVTEDKEDFEYVYQDDQVALSEPLPSGSKLELRILSFDSFSVWYTNSYPVDLNTRKVVIDIDVSKLKPSYVIGNKIYLSCVV